MENRVKKTNVNAVSSESSENNDDEESVPPSKRIKPNSQERLTKAMRSQNQEFHNFRDQIKEYVDQGSQKTILKYNTQSVPRDKIEVNTLILNL